MDHQTLLESFRAECADRDPRARGAAWSALEAELERAVAPQRRRALLSRGGALAAVGAGAISLALVAVVIFSSGSTTEPAVAGALHQAGAVAGSGKGAPTLDAGPGQYYFTEIKALEFEGWYPGSYSVAGGPASRKGGFSALIPKDTQLWSSPEHGQRLRVTMGTPEFLSEDEQGRWQQAGSPLPSGFEPKTDRAMESELATDPNSHVLERGRGVRDFEFSKPQPGPNNYPDLSGVPTDTDELLRAIQDREVPGVIDEPGKPPEADESISALGTLLSRPNAGPELREAAFNALALMPGVELNRNATDLVGRRGSAISFAKSNGLRGEYIFDPESSRWLGERIVLAEPELEAQWKGYPVGLTVRDVAYLRTEVVDSTHEWPAAG